MSFGNFLVPDLWCQNIYILKRTIRHQKQWGGWYLQLPCLNVKYVVELDLRSLSTHYIRISIRHAWKQRGHNHCMLAGRKVVKNVGQESWFDNRRATQQPAGWEVVSTSAAFSTLTCLVTLILLNWWLVFPSRCFRSQIDKHFESKPLWKKRFFEVNI